LSWDKRKNHTFSLNRSAIHGDMDT